MKKTKTLYWIFTILFALIMLATAIPNVMMSEDSVALIHTALGYPKYFIAFIGIVKLFGVIGILIPGFPRVTEWAYAGLFFDLASATISGILAQGFDPAQIGMLMFIVPGVLSYICYHKKLREQGIVFPPTASTAR